MLLRESAAKLSGLKLASISVPTACPDCGREHGQPYVTGLFVSARATVSGLPADGQRDIFAR